jgi:hypothetical protein
VVRGGGETRRKTILAFGLSFTVALMLAQPVSAGQFLIPDRQGDLGTIFFSKTLESKDVWGDNMPLVRAGYLDIESFWLSIEGSGRNLVYKFEMELYADLPDEGEALPGGIRLAEWVMWIDPAPWHPVDNPVGSLFVMKVAYDGSSYTGCLLDYKSPEAPEDLKKFTHVGSVLSLSFPVDRIGDQVPDDPNVDFWWCPGVRAYYNPDLPWVVDMIDLEAAEDYGQVDYDIPWPLED